MASRSSDPSTDATFLFKGTILEIRSATMTQVPVDKNTVIVMVDQVLEAPRNLAKLGGHRVTVRLSGRQKVQTGQELIFYAYGWIFGASVAVQSVKEEAIRQTRAHSALLSRGGDPVAHRYNRQVQQRFASADVVLSGKVTMVRVPAEEATSRTPAKRKGRSRASIDSPTMPMGPVSEHSPHWREALIEIDELHKGQHTTRNVVIRFPASTDVRWYKAPKFQPGNQGFFMLRKTRLTIESKGAAGRVRAGIMAAAVPTPAEVYTALHPADFQPYTQQGGVRTIIDTENG